ncbi:hypothetical protein VTO42DRAFT_63 [Malbranchea cinnamomea]
MRMRRIVTLLGIIALFGFSTFLLGRTHFATHQVIQNPNAAVHDVHTSHYTPLPRGSHPIAQLMTDSEAAFEALLSRQSKTLKAAVKEYQRRYGMRPPPHFDIWFKFAQERGVQLIDEFDIIYHLILPFWGLAPKTIRERAREAIGFDNALISVLIRDGIVTRADGGGEAHAWKRGAITGMMQSFVRYLPDMDLAFNVHDEPRVVVPSEDLQRLVSRAKDVAIPEASSTRWPRNSWSRRPDDLNKGDRVAEVRTTRFNRFAHQAAWTHSRASCPVDTPARDLDDSSPDDVEKYAVGELGFIYNISAYSDICLSPSLRNHFGLFDRPNAVDLVQDLFPIFSESKVSSYQDILYPSPWYWAGKVSYEPERDLDWDSKKDQLYWRGSTTGGYSRAGGWRRHHRQVFVKNINGLSDTKILEKDYWGSWNVKEVPRPRYKDLFNVSFSHVGQCDPDDCNAQSNFFNIVDPEPREEAWKYKYVLDIDGNAFSGRFYAFLLSNSLVYKCAIFREWHNEWLQPWVHFVPLSINGDDHFESVRYFAQEEEGQIRAMHLAELSQQWARKALRNEDLEVWFFRLLLEYGRVIDDNRHRIGYS